MTHYSPKPQALSDLRETQVMQKIVLFIKQAQKAYHTPTEIGNLFLNRFSINEDDESEVLKIYQLQNTYEGLNKGFSTRKEGLDIIFLLCQCSKPIL